MHGTVRNRIFTSGSFSLPFTLRSVYEYQQDERNAVKPNEHSILFRIVETFLRIWDLGFTAFGGPPVHFQIEHRRFVEGEGGYAPWTDEQTVGFLL